MNRWLLLHLAAVVAQLFVGYTYLGLVVNPNDGFIPSRSTQVVDEAYHATPEPNLAIFYNIFIHPDANEDGMEQGRAIVEEQINQIGQSDVMKVAGDGMLVRNVTLYYTSIGHPSAVNQAYMDDLCTRQNNLTCVHQQHFETGFELLTLQAMHEHCENNEHDLAMYFHSKGSYHDNEMNRNWRKVMLSAITNRTCLDIVQTLPGDRDYCNLCGLVFAPRYTHDVPGNFFTGQCQYIKQLRPPMGYAEDLKSVNERVNNLVQSGHLVREHLPADRDWVVGGGRYAAGTFEVHTILCGCANFEICECLTFYYHICLVHQNSGVLLIHR